MLIIDKQFNSLEDLRAENGISEGDVVHTCGYYAVGDGGGATYRIVCENKGAYTDNGGDVIEITGRVHTDPAKAYFGVMLYTGESVNVLQFGAKNKKEAYSSNLAGIRDDSIAIQKTIDFVKSRIKELSPSMLTTESTMFRIPAGTYYLKEQIKFPPYMQMYVEGNVQFITRVGSGNVKLHILDSSNKFSEIDGKQALNYDQEMFATRASKTVGNKTVYYIADKSELCIRTPGMGGSECSGAMTSGGCFGDFFVYRKGAVKICYDYDENGTEIVNPFIGKAAVPAFAKSACIGGPGTLTISNAFMEGVDDGLIYVPAFCCGLEIGDSLNSFNNSTKARYDNINISNVKLCYFRYGLLCHAYNLYSDTFSNMEFYGNVVGYCCGTYGIGETISSDFYGNTARIVGEISYETGEMIHINNSLFAGNAVDCQFMVSGTTHSFMNCHFDFSNCVFHAPMRTCIFANGCHFEGTEKQLKDRAFNGSITSEALENLKDNYDIDLYFPYYGILYAKPMKNFRGGVEKRDYVHLYISNSDICDNYYMPMPLFVFGDEGAMNELSGNPNSFISLKNNSLHVGKHSSISLLSQKNNNFVYSGFMLPDRILSNSVSGSNVAIEAEGNREWLSFPGDNNVHNYRFLSYRTLANKSPLFQNVSYSSDNGWTGISLNKLGFNSPVVPKQENWATLSDYDSNAKGLCFTTDAYASPDNYKQAANSCFDVVPDDKVRCRKGETYRIACVCSEIPYNKLSETNDSGVTIDTYEPVKFMLTVTEYGRNGNALDGEYTYDLPFNAKVTRVNNGSQVAPIAEKACSAAAKHFVRNEDAEKLGLKLKIVVPKTCSSGDTGHDFALCGIFVENDKISWNPYVPGKAN